jgi:hypothetical protein
VIGKHRHQKPAMNMRKIIAKAGFKPWPKLFQNLRTTRESELVGLGIPLQVLCDWIGNSALIAKKHYLQVRDVDFERVMQPESATLAPQQTVPGDPTESHGVGPTGENPEMYVTLPSAAMSCDWKNGRYRTRTSSGFLEESSKRVSGRSEMRSDFHRLRVSSDHRRMAQVRGTDP